MNHSFKFFALLLLLLTLSNAKAQNEFVTDWQINGTSLRFPGLGTDYTIVWEDVNNPAVTGTINNATNGQVITLPGAGTYRVKASNGTGTFNGFNARTYPSNKDNLRFIRQWGNIQWTSLKEAFYSCAFLNLTTTDVPDLTNLTDLSYTFFGTSVLTGNSSLNNWNTANITDMSYMFAFASAFNQAIGSWNTQNVTNMTYMFQRAVSFNQPIGNWNTGNVTNMSNMFQRAEAFNQPVNTWNTSKVTNMLGLFVGALSFNQSLADWNLSASANMNDMLRLTAMDCSNYSATLIGWANAATTPNNITLGATGKIYDSSAQASRDLLVNTKGWTISGDTYIPICDLPTPVTFGDFDVLIQGNNLVVSWNTITEINNKEFIVEASETGINGWRKVATVQSKAENGTSTSGIDYSTTIPLGTTLALSALSLLMVGFIPNKKYRIALACVAIMLSAGMYACNKNAQLEKESSTHKIFIRLSQVDKDGTTKILGIKKA